MIEGSQGFLKFSARSGSECVTTFPAIHPEQGTPKAAPAKEGRGLHLVTAEYQTQCRKVSTLSLHPVPA